jgi:hypothetical protein
MAWRDHEVWYILPSRNLWCRRQRLVLLVADRLTRKRKLSPDRLGTDCLEGTKYNKNKNAPAMIKPALTSRDLCVMMDFSECIGDALL